MNTEQTELFEQQIQLLASEDKTQHFIQSHQLSQNQKISKNEPFNISINPPDQQNQFLLDLNINQNNICTKNRSDSMTRSKIQESSLEIFQKQFIQQQNCIKHKKPLDILCLREKIMICSSCALFGDHKGHQFKNIQEIQKDIVERQQMILKIIDDKEKVQKEKIGYLSIEEVEKELRLKKEQITLKLKNKIDSLLQQVKLVYNQSLQRVERQFVKYRQNYKITYSKLSASKGFYNQWQNKALAYIQKLLQSKTMSQKIKLIKDIGSQPIIITNGKSTLCNFQSMIKQVEKQREYCLNDLELNFDQSMMTKIKTFIQIQTGPQKQLNNINIQNVNISLSSIQNIFEEGLAIQFKRPNIRIQTSLLSLQTSMRSNKKSPLYRSAAMLSPRRSKDIRSQMNSLNKGRYRSPSHNKPQIPIQIARYKRNKLKINQKYDKIMQEVIVNKSQIYDLTNGQLGNQVVLQMLDLLKNNTSVLILKLSKNKLTDDIIPHLWKNLSKVQILNLSNNHFTQKIIDSFMTKLPEVPLLKNLVLTQNKIVSRNMKAKIDQLKQIGILVTL